jgi:beta-barrel assembly-enhancing protease
MALGAEQVQEINASLQLVNDAAVSTYIDALVAQLLADIPAPEGINVRIIDSDGFNAFAISGNNIYLTAGAIKASNNIAELASILAHELAHVLQGDQRQFYRSFKTTRTLANMAGVALALATGNPFLIGAGGIASDVGASTYISTHTRIQERAADELAFRLMLDAGFDPRSQLTLFSRLNIYANNRPDVPVFLQTHPLPQERIENTQARLASLPSGQRLRVGDSGALEEIKGRL